MLSGWKKRERDQSHAWPAGGSGLQDGNGGGPRRSCMNCIACLGTDPGI